MTWSSRLGADSGISKSEVSRICEQLDETVGAFRTRPLDHAAFPTSTSTRPTCTCATSPARAARSSRWPWWWPPGSPPTARREVLGLDVGDSEDEMFWRAFLTQPQATRPGRGAAGHLRPALRAGGGAQAAASRGRRTSGAGSTSPALTGPRARGQGGGESWWWRRSRSRWRSRLASTRRWRAASSSQPRA